VKTRAVFGVRRLDAAFITTQGGCVEEKAASSRRTPKKNTRRLTGCLLRLML